MEDKMKGKIVAVVFILIIFLISAVLVMRNTGEHKVADDFCFLRGFEKGYASRINPLVEFNGINCYENVTECIDGKFCKEVSKKTEFRFQEQEQTKNG